MAHLLHLARDGGRMRNGRTLVAGLLTWALLVAAAFFDAR